ncbi:hypothetical protein BXY53_0612 [Dichotomicrobium thermohalophilum]|uniref:Uncharacterized protein n=1 Tax=Dichotomicrobium thermohalophilum TaxID=933063 RepID=A0A397Q2F6_9HYPH|nr:hypothetical protein BXY53_0612 [Dichotomicrobium thermohalophilum]
MHRRLDADHPPAEINLARCVEQVAHAGMSDIGGAKHRLRLARLVGAPDRLDIHQREKHALGVPQRDPPGGAGAIGELGAHIERHRHRPERAALQPHGVTDAVIISLAQEAVQRRKAAIHQQFEIADLARRQIPARQLPGLALEAFNSLPLRKKLRVLTLSRKWRCRLVLPRSFLIRHHPARRCNKHCNLIFRAKPNRNCGHDKT